MARQRITQSTRLGGDGVAKTKTKTEAKTETKTKTDTKRDKYKERQTRSAEDWKEICVAGHEFHRIPRAPQNTERKY